MPIDLNPPEHPLDALLESARMNASTDWEIGFVDDMLARRKRYGATTLYYEAQIAKLKEIAGED